MTEDEAAALYRCMLLDTLEKARSLTGVTRYLFFDPSPGAAAFFAATAAGMEQLPQQGPDLGARMESAFRQVLARGHASVAIIGTDSPHLPFSYVRSSYDLLGGDATDVVFGPSEDGGYYLIALRELHAPLFKGIAWSSGTVLSESVSIARSAGLRVRLLPQWSDVDTEEDLTRKELLEEENGAALTRAFLLKLTSEPRSHTPPAPGNR